MMRRFTFLAALLAASCAPGLAQYRDLLRDQRAAAERLCETQGGLEIFAPIPERMDVLTVFLNAGEYQVVRGPGDPTRGGTTTYQVITHVPRAEMAENALAWSATAYGIAAHYLSTGRVSAVDLLLEDFQYHRSRSPLGIHTGWLLPDREAPNGMYRYSLERAGDPRCAGFDEMMAAFDEQGQQAGYTPRQEFDAAVRSNNRCIGIAYIGNKDTYIPPSYIYHEYSDDLPDSEVRQVVDELLSSSGDTIARLRNFSAGTRRGFCRGGTTDILEHFQYGKG
ncbi:MAG: hypothetical protein ACLFQ5_10795 [Oceanicaulis sp.]